MHPSMNSTGVCQWRVVYQRWQTSSWMIGPQKPLYLQSSGWNSTPWILHGLYWCLSMRCVVYQRWQTLCWMIGPQKPLYLNRNVWNSTPCILHELYWCLAMTCVVYRRWRTSCWMIGPKKPSYLNRNGWNSIPCILPWTLLVSVQKVCCIPKMANLVLDASCPETVVS